MVKNGDFILIYRFNIFDCTGDEAECMATEYVYIHLVMFKFTIVRMRRAQSKKVRHPRLCYRIQKRMKIDSFRFFFFFLFRCHSRNKTNDSINQNRKVCIVFVLYIEMQIYTALLLIPVPSDSTSFPNRETMTST